MQKSHKRYLLFTQLVLNPKLFTIIAPSNVNGDLYKYKLTL